MLESDGTVFKEIRPGLSNNWAAPIIALFWGLLAVLEVHALNLGKQLPEQLVLSSHARQGWCSSTPTSQPETTTKQESWAALRQKTGIDQNIVQTVFRDLPCTCSPVMRSTWQVRGQDGWMCSLQYPDTFPILSSLPFFNHPGYPLCFCCCTPCQWTASVEAPQSRPVRRT